MNPLVNVESTANVMLESNVAASSSFTSVLSDISACSSENESSEVVDILLLKIFQSAAAIHPNVEPSAVSHASDPADSESPAPVRDVKYSEFSPRVVVYRSVDVAPCTDVSPVTVSVHLL
jgi:hypothetical protein